MDRAGVSRELARGAAVAAVVAGFLVGVESTDWGTPWWVGAAVLLVVAGAIADRGWVTAVPIVLMTAYAAITVDESSSGDMGREGVIALMFVIGSGMGFCVLIGLFARRVWAGRGEPARSAPVSRGASRPRTTP
jgi:hypothetical protein